MTQNKLKAFTLIELLIVIVIIGILAVALLPRLTGAQRQARDTARKTAIQSIVAGIESYRADHNGAFPAVADAGNGVAADTSLTALVPAYLQSIPLDPQGNSYYYMTGTSTASGYAVIADVESTSQGNYPSTGFTMTGSASTAGSFYAIVQK